MTKLIRVGIVGATGYVGQELVRLLLNHPQAEIKVLASQSHAGKPYSRVYPSFAKLIDINCVQEEPQKLAEAVDLLFFALPHGKAAEQITETLIKTVPVIDMGSDFRLKDRLAYEKWYGFKHPNPSLLAQSVYGLSEIRRKAIAKARIIANPGCYATASILALKPLVEARVVDPRTIVIDAKSGVSGAGRSLALDVHFDECNESVKAYKIGSHRHTPEIEQELAYEDKGDSFALTFTPHVVPMNRGILVTAYASINANTDAKAIQDIYHQAYGKEQFIRLLADEGGDSSLPETRWVKGTNFVDIDFRVDKRTGRVVVVAAIDNLMKGAAGQGVQNMNILFGLPEATGLKQSPIFPA